MLKHSENLNDLAKALAAAQGAMEGASKDKVNPHFKSKYADLGSVWDAIRQPLAKNGLSVVQLPYTDEQGRVHVSTMLMHQSGQWIEASYFVLPTKNDAQGIGSVLTYMKRYALTGMGVAPEDDDGNAASAHASGNSGIDPRPPLERPKQAANGNGTGSHSDTKAAAVQWVNTAKQTIGGFSKAGDLRRWEDQPKTVDALLRLKAVDPDLHRDMSDAIEERYSVLSPLNA